MRRKKTAPKVEEEKKEPIEQTKILGKTGYSGKVDIAIRMGNTIISNKRLKNSGSELLFKFLCQCIQGNYVEADLLRPYKIKLFNINEKNELVAVSSFVVTNKAADVQTKKENPLGNVILHFEVPSSSITGAVKKIRLYGRNATTNENYSAEISLDPEIAEIFANTKNNTQILIDWDLQITNASAEGETITPKSTESN